LKAAHKSLKDQLLKARLPDFKTNYSVQGGTMCFAWPGRKIGIKIMPIDKIGLNEISKDWTIYQVTPNQAKNGDARQIIEMILGNAMVK